MFVLQTGICQAEKKADLILLLLQCFIVFLQQKQMYKMNKGGSVEDIKSIYCMYSSLYRSVYSMAEFAT